MDDDDDNGPSRSDGQAIHAVVLVLGDIGRSPRMQYHVKSLLSYRYLQCGANTNITPPPPPPPTHTNSCSPGVHIHVTVVGYQGEKTIDFTSGCSCSSRSSINSNVSSNTAVDMQYIPTFSFNALRRISILHALCKGIALLIAIIHILMFKIKPYEVIIIQNPPCLPALIASILVLWLRGNSTSRIVVDWHNLGFSMFAERLGPNHVLVKLSRFMEYVFTSRAQYHLCVSDAMKQWLQREFSVHPVVLYDRPPDIFRRAPIDLKLRHDLLRKIGLTDFQLFSGKTSSIPTRVVARDDEVPATTRCECAAASSIEYIGCTIQTTTHSSHDLSVVSSQTMRLRTLREGRVGVLISSTSWTEDEDFELLLDALLQVETYLQQASVTQQVTLSGYSRLVVLITGKGPLRCSFEKRVQELALQGRINQCVAVRTLWLSIEDYPQLLRCADLGVCLHTSSSGLDLPMKVLDMLGSGLPVCAYRYPAIGELVEHGHNGCVFKSSDELKEQIMRLLIIPLDDIGGEVSCGNEEIHRVLTQHSNTYGTSTQAVDTDMVGYQHYQDAFKELSRLREATSQIGCWEDNWSAVVAPLLDGIMNEVIRSL